MMSQQSPSVVLLAITAAGPQGLAPLLAQHLPGQNGRIIVFDAASDEAPVLPGRKVDFVDAALGQDEAEGEVDLIRHSLPGFFTLRQPTSTLREIFPGLREMERRSIRRIPFSELTKKLGNKDERISLLVNFPGEERDLLAQLEKSGLLERIYSLTLRCGAERFFDNAMTADEVEAWLAERGFTVAQRDDSDSAWPVLGLVADHDRQQLAALKEQLETAQADLAERDAAAKKAETAGAEMAKRQQTLATETQRLRLALRESDESARRSRAEFDRMRADHGLLLSMLQARADELSALRDGHKKLSDEKRALTDLLRQLTPRLQEAASQLRSLELLPGQSQPDASSAQRQDAYEQPRKREGRAQ